MATIGDILTTPESGWKRFDSSNGLIVSNTTETADAPSYGGRYYYLLNKNDFVTFKFTGTKIRLICVNTHSGYTYPGGIGNITIDDVTETFTTTSGASARYQVLTYEKTGLINGIHAVKVFNPTGGYYLWFDAIDIDSDGKLLHPILEEKSKLEEMNIGDIISCEYTAASGAVGTFANLGNATKDVIPPASVAAPNGSFYFVKVDENLLVADRVVQHSITWDALNAGGYIEGKILPLGERIIPLNTSQSSGTDVQNGYTASKLFDNVTLPKNTNGWWTTSGKNINEWVDFEFNDLTDVSLLVIENGYSSHAVKDYKIQISNDGTNYTDIVSGTLLNIDGLQFVHIPKSKIKFLRIFCINSYGSYLTLSEVYIYSTYSLIRSLSGGCAYIDYLKKKEVALHLPLVSDIIDKSPIPRSVTITGTSTMPVVQEGAGKFGNNSLYFNGTNSTLTLPNNVCNFGTRDFTIDCWVKLFTPQPQNYPMLLGNTSIGSAYNGIYLSDGASNKVSMINNSTGPRAITSTKSINDNIYHHLALQRRNGILQIFIDGILDVSVSYSTSINWNISANIFIGSDGVQSAAFFKGYINDLRIIKGTGIYEGNFTPPTGLLPKQVSELDIPVISTTDQALGAFPNTNEWDKYIVNNDLEGKVTPGDDKLWNWSKASTWIKETGVIDMNFGQGANTSSYRLMRYTPELTRLYTYASNNYGTIVGFRPVLQLIDNKQTNVWR